MRRNKKRFFSIGTEKIKKLKNKFLLLDSLFIRFSRISRISPRFDKHKQHDRQIRRQLDRYIGRYLPMYVVIHTDRYLPMQAGRYVDRYLPMYVGIHIDRYLPMQAGRYIDGYLPMQAGRYVDRYLPMYVGIHTDINLPMQLVIISTSLYSYDLYGSHKVFCKAGLAAESQFSSIINPNQQQGMILLMISDMWQICTFSQTATLWPPQLSGFVCAYHPAAVGSNPKHTIYAFFNLY